MAMRKKWSKRKTSRSRAPWRETRRVDSQIHGGPCISGLQAECTDEIDGTHFVFPQPGAGCFTIALYPVLYAPDWQSLGPDWKERIVHTHTSVNVWIQPNYLWMASVARRYLEENQTTIPSAILIAPWRCCLMIYDDDEVLDPTGSVSLFQTGWQETERYLPGTFREGRIYHQSSVVDGNQAGGGPIRIESRHRRRLETGEGLYWQFEMGCVTFAGQDGTGADIDHIDAFGNWAGPFWMLGQFSSSYIE